MSDPRIPMMPIAAGAVQAMRSHLEALDSQGVVLEFGCGMTTEFFRRYCRFVVSVERDADYAAVVGKELVRQREEWGLPGEGIIHVQPGGGYVMVPLWYPQELFDVVLVAGRERMRCLSRSKLVLKPGGLMVLLGAEHEEHHDAYRYCQGWEYEEHEGDGHTDTVWRKP